MKHHYPVRHAIRAAAIAITVLGLANCGDDPLTPLLEVSCFSAAPRSGTARASARVSAAVVAAQSVCADTWVGTATLFLPGDIRIDASVTWKVDPTKPAGAGQAYYNATGAAIVKNIAAESTGCMVFPSVFNIAQSEPAHYANALLVDYNASPPVFMGEGRTGSTLTESCAGEVSTISYIYSWFGGSGQVSPSGVIEGRSQVGNGYWEWRFERP